MKWKTVYWSYFTKEISNWYYTVAEGRPTSRRHFLLRNLFVHLFTDAQTRSTIPLHPIGPLFPSFFEKENATSYWQISWSKNSTLKYSDAWATSDAEDE